MIPKKIHFCWLSGDEYPTLIKNCINSWKSKLPDYEVIVWDRKKINLAEHTWARQAFEAGKYAFAADYIRLYAVYHEGGIYLDSDVEVLKSFDSLLHLKSFIGTEATGDFEPATFGAESYCEWVGLCLEYYASRNFVMPSGQLDMIPLPIIIGKALKTIDIIPQKENVRFYESAGLSVFPPVYFSPKSLHHLDYNISDKTYSIHHFDGSWVEKNLRFRFKRAVHRLVIDLFGRATHSRLIRLIRNF